MLGPSSLSGVPPAYISGTIMVPGHQHTHAGTLRRTLIPTSMGLMSSASPPPPVGLGIGPGTGMGLPPHSLASTGSGVYYDSTVPRNLARGMSTEGSGQYFYGWHSLNRKASLPIAIAVRPQPHLNFNMLPMSATMGLGSPLVPGGGESGSSRAGTPTNGNTKSDIPAITVTASPGPSSILHTLKQPPTSISGSGLTKTTATTPTGAGGGGGGMPMSTSGRSQCF